MEEKPTILVDVDGVICRQNVPALLFLCRDVLKLPISSAELTGLNRDEFEALPQVQAYRENIGERAYRWRMAVMEWHPRYIQQCLPMSEAVVSVQGLAEKYDLGYCTARFIHWHQQWNSDLAIATRIWLRKYKFPNVNRILFCDKPKGKLQVIAQDLQEKPELKIVLIDDSVADLVEGYSQLAPEMQHVLQERFTLIGYAHDGNSCEKPFPLLPASTWEEIHAILEQKQQR